MIKQIITDTAWKCPDCGDWFLDGEESCGDCDYSPNVYRIVEKSDNVYKTLFHGYKGSRILPTNEWLRSEQKTVRDGSKGKYYTSGWHVIKDKDECIKFMNKRFVAPRELAVVKCHIKGDIWPKAHSPYPILLCEWIKIISEVQHRRNVNIMRNKS